jgi:hypothetical protein
VGNLDNWEKLRGSFVGKTYIFFGYRTFPIATPGTIVNSSAAIKPEPIEREQEIREFLKTPK